MIGKYPKCYNRYIIQNKVEIVMNKHKSNKIKENSNTVRHLIMGQITTTQNLVAIKEVRHAGQKCDKNCVITVSISTNVKFEILVFISVEHIVVQPNGLLYISSYKKWSWDNKPLHWSDAMSVPYLWAGCLCLAEKLAEAVM